MNRQKENEYPPGIQRWKVNNLKANKNGVHNTVYWVSKRKKIFSNAQSYKVKFKYKGQWENDKKNGFGVQIYAKGSKYEGEWKDNKRHGKGTLWFMNTKKKLIRQYTGEWKIDKKNGSGTMFFQSGNRYDGFWVNNKMNGYGRMVYSNNDIYVGLWYNGRRNGYGFLTKNNGDHFEGNWVDDKREGNGSYIFKEKQTMIIGEWVDDSPKTAIYTGISSDDMKNVLELPKLQLEKPAQIISELFIKIKKNRLVYRIRNSPIHFLFKELEIQESFKKFNKIIETQGVSDKALFVEQFLQEHEALPIGTDPVEFLEIFLENPEEELTFKIVMMILKFTRSN